MAPRAEVAAKARVMLGAAVVLGLASCVRAPASLPARGAAPAAARAPLAEGAGRQARMAFVLLAEPSLPAPERIQAALAALAPEGRRPRLTLDPTPEEPGKPPLHVFGLEGGGQLFVALMPHPIPDGEAEYHAQWSFWALVERWKPRPHQAHLMVMWRSEQARGAVEDLRGFTLALAAVGQAAQGVGIYWGQARATHPVEAFARVAGDTGLGTLMTLWSGVSIASDRGNPKRSSVLSLGMGQVGLPDLELSVPGALPLGESLGWAFDLLGYLAERGQPLPEGDTIGRTAQERLPIHYVTSPVEPEKQVWRVEVP